MTLLTAVAQHSVENSESITMSWVALSAIIPSITVILLGWIALQKLVTKVDERNKVQDEKLEQLRSDFNYHERLNAQTFDKIEKDSKAEMRILYSKLDEVGKDLRGDIKQINQNFINFITAFSKDINNDGLK